MDQKCKGCNLEARTPKGWCSRSCYLKNQPKNKGQFKKGRVVSEQWRQDNSARLKKWHKKHPEKSAELVQKMNTVANNLKKSHKGKNHPRWIIDRTQLKKKRGIYEEKEFFAKILQDREYICEVTKQKGGRLSVHHIDSVHLCPEKRFDKANVIVVSQEIHKQFHLEYGFQWANREKWNKFLEKHGYVN